MTSIVVNQAIQLAEKFGIDSSNANGQELINVLKNTCFKTSETVSDAQLSALLIVAAQYSLNPFTKEIYAFPDKKNGIVPVVGVDGWSRIINGHDMLDGIEFNYSEKKVLMPDANTEAHEWIECVITRKDRSKPVVIREYLTECYRPPFEGKGQNGTYKVNGPWQTHPNRFLRHKTLIQGSRVAFGFTGIYDQDEGERIVGGVVIDNETGNVSGDSAVTMPKRAKANDVQDVDPTQTKEADKKPEQTDQTSQGESAEAVAMPVPGQLKWIEQKCKSLDLSVVGVLGSLGFDVPLEKLTLAEWETVKKDLMAR